jgi:sulfite reductase alpha subunit
MSWDGSKLTIDNKNCVRCMHCINTMPRALRVGKETGATLLLGAKAPILDGQQLASMIVPFIPAEEPFDEIKEVVENLWDWWMEEGKNRERIGESMRRVGMQFMLNLINQEPVPQHVAYPRENPYIFWKEDEVPGGFDRSIEEYRKRHAR